MEAARHLHSVDVATGEVLEGCPDCAELADQVKSLNKVVTARDRTISEVRNELSNLRAVAPERDEVLSVLQFHRDCLMPGAKISEHMARWGVVHGLLKMKDDETGKALFTALDLKAAITGMTLQPFIMDPENRFARDLTWAFTSQPAARKPGAKSGPRFPDPGQVQKHIDHAVKFKRHTGVSALDLVDELGGEALLWLAERCSCGHTWLTHLRGGEAAQGGAQGCSHMDCGCPMFDHFHAQVERHMREQTDGDLGARS